VTRSKPSMLRASEITPTKRQPQAPSLKTGASVGPPEAPPRSVVGSERYARQAFRRMTDKHTLKNYPIVD
jgi:hypothetical protein